MTNTLKSFLLGGLLSISLQNAKAQISDTVRLFPNPFDEFTILQFKLYEADTVSISFLDALGRISLRPLTNQILTSGQKEIRISTDSIAAGIYVIKIDCGSGVVKKTSGVKIAGNTSREDFMVENKNTILFPNPTSGWVSIPVSPDVKLIKISDLNGRMVKELQISGNEFSIKDLNAGVYQVEVRTKENALVLRQKLFKIE